MRKSLILGLGTGGSSAVLHFRRRREVSIRSITRDLMHVPLGSRPALEQMLESLRGSIRILAIDLDGTDAYRLPMPLDSQSSGFGIGESMKISLHAREVTERFQSRQIPGLESLNPAALRGLDAENASGGARPNAELAFQIAKDRIKPALRDAMVGLLANTQILSSSSSDGIRVFLVLGTFGGTGTGGYDCVRLWLLELAADLGVHLDVYPLLLMPGAHVPKDPANSYANTFALFKEFAADATGSYWRVGSNGGPFLNDGFRAPFLISDTNNAPGSPRVISSTALGVLAGDIIYELTVTSLGSHLDAQIGDFSIAGVTLTSAGEPKQARSLGMSAITLDLERMELYSRSILASEFVARALKSVPEGMIRQNVRAFLEGNSIVLGDGRTDLADRLLSLCSSREKLSLTRLRFLFASATEGLESTSILSEGRTRLSLAIQQCGDFGPALERHADEEMEAQSSKIAAEVRRLLTEPSRGPASASQWLSVAGGILDAMLSSAGADMGQLQVDLVDLEAKLQDTEARYREEIQSRGSLYRAWHRSELSRLGTMFRTDLEALATLRIKTQSIAAAIRVLHHVRQSLQGELQRTVQPTLGALSACAEMLRESKKRAIDHSVEYNCPNGLSLLVSETDLESLHTRSFGATDVSTVTEQFFACLTELPDPVEILSDASALVSFFERESPRTLLGTRMSELHVVDELRRRFPNVAQLGSVLRQRDLEAFERVPLASTSQQSNGLMVVRFAGVDASRTEVIRSLLGKYQSERGSEYLLVDTADRARIVFLQARAVFPFSDWRGFGTARAHYESVRASGDFEKQHVIPGNRFLPAPGIRMDQRELGVLLLRAWVLNRLRSDNSVWTLTAANENEMPYAMDSLAAVPPQVAYRIAVDVISSTNCFLKQHGPGEFRRRLANFESTPCGPEMELLRRFVTPANLKEGIRRLLSEMDWWERNTHPMTCGEMYALTVAD